MHPGSPIPGSHLSADGFSGVYAERASALASNRRETYHLAGNGLR